MGYSTSDFLPDFPVNESLQELRFHLRSLYYDLLSEIKSTKALSVFVPSNKSEYHRLRNESEDISTGAEHYVCYHLVKALKLADKELSLPSLTDIWSQITCQELEVADGDSPLSSEQITQYTLDFQKEVKEVLSQLCLSLNIVSRFVENERLVKETILAFRNRTYTTCLRFLLGKFCLYQSSYIKRQFYSTKALPQKK